MTNGGGCLEDQKAHEISSVFFPGLSVPVRPTQVQLSHTPMKALVPEYRDKQILVSQWGVHHRVWCSACAAFSDLALCRCTCHYSFT